MTNPSPDAGAEPTPPPDMHAGAESAAASARDPQGSPPVADDALGAAARALGAVEQLPLERHPEAFAHFDELLRAALEAPGHVASG
jgi:hypothetical protein